jgi:hypothetical protein
MKSAPIELTRPTKQCLLQSVSWRQNPENLMPYRWNFRFSPSTARKGACRIPSIACAEFDMDQRARGH